MATKIKAAEIVVAANASMIIAEGSEPNIINDILEGREIGTLFERIQRVLMLNRIAIAY